MWHMSFIKSIWSLATILFKEPLLFLIRTAMELRRKWVDFASNQWQHFLNYFTDVFWSTTLSDYDVGSTNSLKETQLGLHDPLSILAPMQLMVLIENEINLKAKHLTGWQQMSSDSRQTVVSRVSQHPMNLLREQCLRGPSMPPLTTKI